MTAPRVLFYVQHLLGIGHLRRAMTLSRALCDAGLAVTLVSGGMPDESEAPAGIAVVRLPPVRAGDAELRTLVDAAGRPLDAALRARRREQLLATLAATAPHSILIESYPFGRRAFRFELEPLLAAARASRPRPLILSSIRDVLVSKGDPARAAEILGTIRRDFDLVLVHGDPRFIPLEASFPAAAQLGDKLFYTGYVARARDDGGTTGAGEVLVSAGGGAVGARLFAAALAARPLTPLAHAPWRLVTGPHLAESVFRDLTAAAPMGVTVERFRADLPTMLGRCALSISQAGYNTVVDLIGAHARAIVVPFARGNETEQLQRSERLASRGLVTLLRESEIDPPRLAAATIAALAAPPMGDPPLDLGGARRSAEKIRALVGAQA